MLDNTLRADAAAPTDPGGEQDAILQSADLVDLRDRYKAALLRARTMDRLDVALQKADTVNDILRTANAVIRFLNMPRPRLDDTTPRTPPPPPRRAPTPHPSEEAPSAIERAQPVRASPSAGASIAEPPCRSIGEHVTASGERSPDPVPPLHRPLSPGATARPSAASGATPAPDLRPQPSPAHESIAPATSAHAISHPGASTAPLDPTSPPTPHPPFT